MTYTEAKAKADETVRRIEADADASIRAGHFGPAARDSYIAGALRVALEYAYRGK